ncbi:MAG: transglycosylase domain-containing protein [Firmicutes bacterium]|nr:transglycosylase domain-containing protein [Bacillota bacterium]
MSRTNRNKKIDWSEELVNALRLLRKIFFRAIGYVLNILLTLLLIGLITGSVVGGAFLIYVTNYVDSSVNGIVELFSSDRNLTTKICYMDFTDRENGIGTVREIEEQRIYGVENSIWVDYEDIPQQLIDALVCTEDKRFWTHQGVDWITTTKKAFLYFTGRMDGGASTITQQLIKNATGDNEVTIQRKAQEILRALNLEKELDKTEILELYMNSIYLGRGCYGVGAAAYTYFGKELNELTELECIAIAGITQNPSKYDPYMNPENNKKRREAVIQSLYNEKKITSEHARELINQDIEINYHGKVSSSTTNMNSWYTDAAIEESINLIMDYYKVSYHVAEQMIYTSGFQIVTAQDPDIQNELEQYYLDSSNFPAVDQSFIQPECSCVVIHPVTGDVLGLVGGRGEKLGNRILNYATQTKRPPGSSIKPISIYAPALEKGLITYGSIIDDTPINFGTTTINEETGETEYSRPNGYPNNLPNVYNGLTTIHSAIRRSVNTVAWKVLDMLTLEESYKFLTENLGISTLVYNQELTGGVVVSDVSYAPLALGQLSYGMTVKEITAAYSIFANHGIYNKPRLVLKILDSNGEVLIDNPIESKIVISEQNACIMTKMLEEVVDSGTASKLTLKSVVDTAGKTGTTTSDNDRWFVGYTPYYICGVWFGYSMPQSLGGFSATSSPALLVWDDIMNALHAKKIAEEKSLGHDIKQFELAAGVVTAKYCADSGKILTTACKSDPRGSRAEIGYFTTDTVPTEECDVHVLVNYDTVTKAIANEYCPSQNVKQVGLLKIKRSLELPIKITDAQYVYWELPFGIKPGGNENQPFFINAIPEGTYVGFSNSLDSPQFNHICSEHCAPDDSTDDGGLDDPDHSNDFED